MDPHPQRSSRELGHPSHLLAMRTHHHRDSRRRPRQRQSARRSRHNRQPPTRMPPLLPRIRRTTTRRAATTTTQRLTPSSPNTVATQRNSAGEYRCSPTRSGFFWIRPPSPDICRRLSPPALDYANHVAVTTDSDAESRYVATEFAHQALDPSHPAWDACPWLDDLRDVPANATWPRLMTSPHPRAVGSWGAEIADFAVEHDGRPLRYWQRLVLLRLMEYDDENRLIWNQRLMSTARQVGKSWLLRILAMWRLTQSGWFGEEQLVLHTGKDLPGMSGGSASGEDVGASAQERGLRRSGGQRAGRGAARRTVLAGSSVDVTPSTGTAHRWRSWTRLGASGSLSLMKG